LIQNQIKICFFTFIRSDYGLQIPLLKGFLADPLFDVKFVVSGAHFLKEFDRSIDLIYKDGFQIDQEIDFLSIDSAKIDFAKSLSNLTLAAGRYLESERPDAVLLYGDRYELLPMSTLCLVNNIPMIHVSGGEVTEGAIDNQIRNALSKLSHLHLVAAEEYKQNLIHMGEQSWRILVCGEPGLASLINFLPIPKSDLYADLQLDEKKKTILVTFHPETIQNEITIEFIENLISKLSKMDQIQLVITGSNADDYGLEINDFFVRNESKFGYRFILNLGMKRYYSLLNYASLMLGNTSSGLYEAQSFHLPVINVGKRQKGRALNTNVINVIPNSDKILSALELGLSDEFQWKIHQDENIFFDKDSIGKIIHFIKENIRKPDLLMKLAI
jgi:UDP-hydrolysing UDP-N-acetyl-D-glucosamine 2-epimerase